MQNVLPPDRSAEGTSVLMTVLISLGGIGVVAAAAVVEAIGGGRASAAGIDVTLYFVAGFLLPAGAVTLVVEGRRLRQRVGNLR